MGFKNSSILWLDFPKILAWNLVTTNVHILVLKRNIIFKMTSVLIQQINEEECYKYFGQGENI